MIGTIAQTMVGFTILLLMVLARRRPVAFWAGARWAYALWLLPLIWLLVPIPLTADT